MEIFAIECLPAVSTTPAIIEKILRYTFFSYFVMSLVGCTLHLKIEFLLTFHFHLRISPRIFEKIRNGPNGIVGGPGETDS